MTLDEARAKLKDAKWTREVPLVTLFDEVLEVGLKIPHIAAGTRTSTLKTETTRKDKRR